MLASTALDCLGLRLGRVSHALAGRPAQFIAPMVSKPHGKVRRDLQEQIREKLAAGRDRIVIEIRDAGRCQHFLINEKIPGA